MRVLIVEDDPGIAQGLATTLKAAGYAVDACERLSPALAALRSDRFDLVLLDLGLPDGDGLDLLRQLRARGAAEGGTPSDAPVLIMTARDALPDRVQGLDRGADDYLVKPVAPEELLARMRVALRRSAGRADPVIRHGDIELDPAARTVRRDGQPVTLRGKEYALLQALLLARGQVLARDRLEAALYGFDELLDSNALEVHVHHLRRKLGNELIQTVRGVGYFIPRPDAP